MKNSVASQIDIIKNFLFGKAPEAVGKIQPRWMSMLSTIESHGNDELLLTFIRQHWISQHGPTTENDLGEEIETAIKNEPKALSFVTDLDAAASDYVALLTPIQHPRWQGPFTWTADPDKIIRAVKRRRHQVLEWSH